MQWSADRNAGFSRADPESLPMTVEGIVTTYPRYFQKKLVCGEDERFYGSYFLQDSTGGILVLRDSRIANFTFGDRVRLKVRGILGGQLGEGAAIGEGGKPSGRRHRQDSGHRPAEDRWPGDIQKLYLI